MTFFSTEFLSKFTVVSLQNLQSLFLDLALGQVIEFLEENIFSVVGV